ncbi:hypothetical protein [Piscirickettsia salmonis]|uniref:hypothetical protein n=1 Tax=Piscirickettsia salmonis TaxID=1238 RepID=UPI001662277D|nr:hypothetical protein [Piscirickettsia salmonis]QNR80174.1 hypothetical protein ICC15_14820 [Piscirickettsia salmonis]
MATKRAITIKSVIWKEFQKFIDQNPGKTHQQLADLYPVEMSAKTMGVWIKKLGYTRKKELQIPRT